MRAQLCPTSTVAGAHRAAAPESGRSACRSTGAAGARWPSPPHDVGHTVGEQALSAGWTN